MAERLQLLALMRCRHANIDSRYTRFWEFINPTFEEEIPAGDVMDLIKEMSILALPVLQEAFGGEDANQEELYPGVLRYLKTMEDKMESTVQNICVQDLRKGFEDYKDT